ncbi:hypothetical protein NDU88_000813 [Pleurodeles waltl]|uniref:Uncharacterized protein n=1 Tax=Pleurodeles waltl TaxID=8319 RepID=A0AAV7UR32_PLEWA|nr:hypothetical protein NDU88_000813 [Pleurodeles waltl]
MHLPSTATAFYKQSVLGDRRFHGTSASPIGSRRGRGVNQPGKAVSMHPACKVVTVLLVEGAARFPPPVLLAVSHRLSAPIHPHKNRGL